MLHFKPSSFPKAIFYAHTDTTSLKLKYFVEARAFQTHEKESKFTIFKFTIQDCWWIWFLFFNSYLLPMEWFCPSSISPSTISRLSALAAFYHERKHRPTCFHQKFPHILQLDFNLFCWNLPLFEDDIEICGGRGHGLKRIYNLAPHEFGKMIWKLQIILYYNRKLLII